ncbi:MAG: NAD(P)H-dependent oxidoreductase subunit E [bacterium]|jgi:NADH:ubiquinone oxidoreductase subunit E
MPVGSIWEGLSQAKEIITKYPREQRFLLAALQDIQKEYNYLPREVLGLVREHFSVPMSRLYSMATFYKALTLEPKGQYVIKVCDGTACHIRGSGLLIEEIQRLLKIAPGETSADGKYSLETVNCLGSCALAPVMVINDQYYGKVAPASLGKILDELEAKG